MTADRHSALAVGNTPRPVALRCPSCGAHTAELLADAGPGQPLQPWGWVCTCGVRKRGRYATYKEAAKAAHMHEKAGNDTPERRGWKRKTKAS